jgi:hypothetical protein
VLYSGCSVPDSRLVVLYSDASISIDVYSDSRLVVLYSGCSVPDGRLVVLYSDSRLVLLYSDSRLVVLYSDPSNPSIWAVGSII